MILFRRSKIKKELEFANKEIDTLQREKIELTESLAYLVDVMLRENVQLTEFDKLALGNLESVYPKK